MCVWGGGERRGGVAEGGMNNSNEIVYDDDGEYSKRLITR